MSELLAGASPPAKPAADSAFEAELKAIVRPHLAPEEDSDLPRLREAVDEARSGLLRAILRSPRFRELEAAWRSLDLLVRRVEEESIRIFFLDASREALLEDVTSHEKLSGTGLYRRLVTETVDTPGAEPWGAILGLYDFGPTLADAALLSRMAKLARAAGAPFLAGARSDFVGCASLAATPDPVDWRVPEGEGAIIWEELRALPEAAWVALALPRLMLRRPYGAKTEPIDSFPFEEIPAVPEHEAYVWGNARACVRPRPRGRLRTGRVGSQARDGGRDSGPAHARLQGRSRDPRHPAVRGRPDAARRGEAPRGRARSGPVAEGQRERARRAPPADRETAARAGGQVERGGTSVMDSSGFGYRPPRFHLLDQELHLDPDIQRMARELETRMAARQIVGLWLRPDFTPARLAEPHVPAPSTSRRASVHSRRRTFHPAAGRFLRRHRRDLSSFPPFKASSSRPTTRACASSASCAPNGIAPHRESARSWSR